MSNPFSRFFNRENKSLGPPKDGDYSRNDFLFEDLKIEGAIAPRNLTAGSSSRSLSLEDSSREGMRALSWVYACVDKKSKTVASCPLVCKSIDKNDKKIYNSTITDLAFNSGSVPYSVMIIRMMQHLELTGNAFFRKIRNKNLETVSIEQINPDNVIVTVSKSGKVKYDIRSGGSWKQHPASDIVHLMYPDPEYENWGLSPLEAASRAVDSDNMALDHNKNGLLNGASIGGIMSFKNRITPKQREDAEKKMAERHGGPGNAKKILVVGDDVTFMKTTMSNAEMDFLSLRKWSLVEICTAFGVPPAIMHQDNANYNNMETAMNHFWHNISDLLIIVENMLNHSFRDELFLLGRRLEFDTSSRPANISILKKKSEVGIDLSKMGVPFNRINERLSLDVGSFDGDDMTVKSG